MEMAIGVMVVALVLLTLMKGAATTGRPASQSGEGEQTTFVFLEIEALYLEGEPDSNERSHPNLAPGNRYPINKMALRVGDRRLNRAFQSDSLVVDDTVYRYPDMPTWRDDQLGLRMESQVQSRPQVVRFAKPSRSDGVPIQGIRYTESVQISLHGPPRALPIELTYKTYIWKQPSTYILKQPSACYRLNTGSMRGVQGCDESSSDATPAKVIYTGTTPANFLLAHPYRVRIKVITSASLEGCLWTWSPSDTLHLELDASRTPRDILPGCTPF